MMASQQWRHLGIRGKALDHVKVLRCLGNQLLAFRPILGVDWETRDSKADARRATRVHHLHRSDGQVNSFIFANRAEYEKSQRVAGGVGSREFPVENRTMRNYGNAISGHVKLTDQNFLACLIVDDDQSAKSIE